MPKIAVFDSGLGSLSIIRHIMKKVRADIIYLADQENYPYGTKSVPELKKIIESTITKLRSRFHPDVIVIGSNTPSILLDLSRKRKVIGVYPPLDLAAKITKTGKIAILATESVIKSRNLSNYIKKNLPRDIVVIKINASPLVDLVESTKFIRDTYSSRKIIKKILRPMKSSGCDIATLSSTHLPFLISLLQESFSDVTFLDPGYVIANKVARSLNHKRSKRSRLKIYATGDVSSFQKKLRSIGIRDKVIKLG